MASDIAPIVIRIKQYGLTKTVKDLSSLNKVIRKSANEIDKLSKIINRTPFAKMSKDLKSLAISSGKLNLSNITKSLKIFNANAKSTGIAAHNIARAFSEAATIINKTPFAKMSRDLKSLAISSGKLNLSNIAKSLKIFNANAKSTDVAAYSIARAFSEAATRSDALAGALTRLDRVNKSTSASIGTLSKNVNKLKAKSSGAGLNRLAASMKSVQASSAAAATSGIQFNKCLARIETTSNRVSGSIRTKLIPGLKGLKTRMLNLAGIAVTLATSIGLTKIGSVSDSYTLLENRIRLTTKSTSELSSVMRYLNVLAKKNFTSINTVADLYGRLAFSLIDLGYSSDQVLQMTDNLTAAIRLSGAGAAEAQGALVQLSQGLAAGTLRGQELNSVMEQLPVVSKMIIAELSHLGVTTMGDLRKMANEGKLTTDIVANAIINSSVKIQEQISSSTVTAGQAFTNLTTELKAFAVEFNRVTGFTKKASAFFKWTEKAVKSLTLYLKSFRSTTEEAAKEAKATVDIWAETWKEVDRLNKLKSDSVDSKILTGTREKIDRLNKLKPARPIKDTTPEIKGTSSLVELTRAQQVELDLLKQIKGPMEEKLLKLEALDRLYASGKISLEEFNDVVISLDESLTRQKNIVEGINAPWTTYNTAIRDYIALLSQGAISQEQFEQGVEKIGKTLRSSLTPEEIDRNFGVFQQTLDSIKVQMISTGGVIKSGFETAMSGATSAIENFVKKGTVSFRQFFADLFLNIAKLLLQQALLQGFFAMFGGVGGIVGGGGGAGNAVSATANAAKDVSSMATKTAGSFSPTGSIGNAVSNFGTMFGGGVGQAAVFAGIGGLAGLGLSQLDKHSGFDEGAAGRGAGPAGVNIKIVNVLPGELDEMENTAGERVIMNVISRNADQVREIIGG